ncbi:phage major capsid protein [Flavobacterium aestivum]|uniref:phage major capsid protein n=1 Tax=Flavobacterium aestivum TaxID=3003257 RepID=UPI002285FD6F|nr:phage major capsid protein [Flavobacterium aestivum]
MKRSAELKQKRAQKIEAQKTLRSKVVTEKRDMTEEETTEFRALQKDIDGLTGQIKDEVAYEENLRSLEGSGDAGFSFGGGDGKDGEQREMEKIKKRFNIGSALRMAGSGKWDGVEKEVNEIGVNELRSAGKEVSGHSFSMPASMVRSSAQTVSEDGGLYGGKLVQNQAPRIVDSFIPKLFIEELGATVLTGLSGGKLPLPVAANYAFSWLNETEDASSQKATVDGPELDPKRAAAVVLISNRLINNASIDAQAMVMKNLGSAAASALNNAAINGLGVKDPRGLLNMTGLGAGSYAAATLPTWALVNELKGKIQSADSTEQSLGYLCDPALMALLETIQKANGIGFIAENGKIGGQKSVATSLVKAIAGTPELHTMIFGDWSQLFVGQWDGIQFVVDPLTAASANSLKVTVNMEADVQVANKKAFAVNSFFKLS